MTYQKWVDSIEEASYECSANLTKEQVVCIAEWVQGMYENLENVHGHAPSSSDMETWKIREVKDENIDLKSKIVILQAELEEKDRIINKLLKRS